MFDSLENARVDAPWDGARSARVRTVVIDRLVRRAKRRERARAGAFAMGATLLFGLALRAFGSAPPAADLASGVGSMAPNAPVAVAASSLDDAGSRAD
jgi:hypothetical protein